MSEVGRQAACLCDLLAGLCLFDNQACVWLLSSSWAEYHCIRKGFLMTVSRYVRSPEPAALLVMGVTLGIGGSVGSLKPKIFPRRKEGVGAGVDRSGTSFGCAYIARE